MNWADLLVLALLLLSALVGLLRGFVREALGLCAWIAAALLAIRFSPEAEPFARRLIGDDSVADPVAFLAVFGVLLIAFLLVAAALGGLVRGSLLGGLDRLAGFGFGVLRGFAVLAIAYLVAVPLLPEAGWPHALTASRSLPYVRAGAAFVAVRLPERFRPDLAPPPPADAGAS